MRDLGGTEQIRTAVGGLADLSLSAAADTALTQLIRLFKIKKVSQS